MHLNIIILLFPLTILFIIQVKLNTTIVGTFGVRQYKYL